MRTTNFLAEIVCLILCLAPGSIGYAQETANDFFNSGKGKSRICDFDGAIADLNRAIELDPKNADAYKVRGQAKRAERDFDGAIADFNKAIELHPDYRTFVVLASTKLAKGDFDGAIAGYDEAIKLNPSFVAPIYVFRGQAKRAKGDLNGAISDCSKTIELSKRPEYHGHLSLLSAYSSRGEAKQANGDSNGAISDCSEAIKLGKRPEYHIESTSLAQAYCSRGDAKGAKGDTAGAVADYNSALGVVLKPGQFGFTTTTISPLSIAKSAVNAGATYAVTTNSVEELYSAGRYLKLLADKQTAEGLMLEAKQNYVRAREYLTIARNEFIMCAKNGFVPQPQDAAASRKPTQNGFWNIVLQGLADSMADMNQYNTANRQNVQVFALSHAKTLNQYDQMLNQMGKNYHPSLTPLMPSGVVSAPSGVVSATHALAGSQNIQAGFGFAFGTRLGNCIQLLDEIQNSLGEGKK